MKRDTDSVIRKATENGRLEIQTKAMSFLNQDFAVEKRLCDKYTDRYMMALNIGDLAAAHNMSDSAHYYLGILTADQAIMNKIQQPTK